jgi:hypothetical protein
VAKGRRRGTPRLEGDLLYREVQTYAWPWPGMLIVLVGLVTFGAVLVPFSHGMWQQLVLGRPWGDRPMPDGMLYVVGPLAILLSLLPFAVLFTRLLVEVRTDGIRLELLSFKGPRVIPPGEVQRAALARIGPVGWGESRQGRRLVYRISGSEGVELELTNGKKVVVSSEHPRRLLEAVLAMVGARTVTV